MLQKPKSHYTVRAATNYEASKFDNPGAAALAFHTIAAVDQPSVILTSDSGARVIATTASKTENGVKTHWKYSSENDQEFHAAYKAVAQIKAVIQIEKLSTGPRIDEWEARIPGTNDIYPMIAICSATHIEQDDPENEDCGHLSSFIFITDPEARPAAMEIAHNLLHFGVATCQKDTKGLVIRVCDRHQVILKNQMESEQNAKVNDNFTLYGTITADKKDRSILEGTGALLGLGRAIEHSELVEFSAKVSKEAMKELDPFWGTFTWALSPLPETIKPDAALVATAPLTSMSMEQLNAYKAYIKFASDIDQLKEYKDYIQSESDSKAADAPDSRTETEQPSREKMVAQDSVFGTRQELVQRLKDGEMGDDVPILMSHFGCDYDKAWELIASGQHAEALVLLEEACPLQPADHPADSMTVGDTLEAEWVAHQQEIDSRMAAPKQEQRPALESSHSNALGI